MRSPGVCPLCLSGDTVRLTDPGTQSMTSDWRVVPIPLGKVACRYCDLAYRDQTLPRAADFSRDYGLYAHPAGRVEERRRQDAYADWITRVVDRPRRVLDVGCGNGSLLLAIRDRWPDAELLGCDPSPEGVRFAQAAGLTAWSGTVANLPRDGRADLVVSVNVIEHTTDPRTFACGLADAVDSGGQLVLICPDGARPGVELLIADHLFSFTRAHVQEILGAAGFAVRAWNPAPRALGSFQMAVASRDTHRATTPAARRRCLLGNRQAYLEAWRQLDASLAARLPSGVVCFGAGEAAGLLRAYAPGAWARVTACTTDDAATGRFGDLPHVTLADVPNDATVLVGVRPQDQPAVATRLRSRFAHVVTWYDLVPSDDAG